MALELGKEYRLYVGATPATLGGENTLTVDRSSQEIDTSSKDDAVYAFSDFGLQKLTITVAGKVKLPDTALEEIVDAQKNATNEVTINIKKSATTKFTCSMAVGNLSVAYPHDGPATYSFTLVPVAAPTVDDLVA